MWGLSRASALPIPVIVDLQSIYRADEMRQANFRYVAVRRPSVD
jgi:hypothetical protein